MDTPTSRPAGRPSGLSQLVQEHAPPPEDSNTHQHIHLGSDGEVHSHDFHVPKRARVRPSDLQDDLATMAFDLSVMDGLNDLDLNDPSGEDPASFLDGEGADVDLEGDTGKRKRYQSSDDPMAGWRAISHDMLLETFRRFGLGQATRRPECATCGDAFVEPVPPLEDVDEQEPRGEPAASNGDDDLPPPLTTVGDPPEHHHQVEQGTCSELLQCLDCGDFLQCRDCCVKRHERSPLHVIQSWNGDFFEKTSLRDLGLVYQLGHQGGECPTPDSTPRLMTVLHVNGIHVVAYRYCGCSVSDYEQHWQQLFRNGWYPATTTSPQTCASIQVLDSFRSFKVDATVNARDFVTVLERMSDPLGTEWTADRYKAFTRMSRQWAYLQRVRRSGVPMDEGGLAAAKPGSLVVECLACPRTGVNLPENWEELDAKYHYRYRRTFSIDANFRMVNKMRAEAHPDPPLYDGLGVQMPGRIYGDWLTSYITEEEVSSCIAFAALMQKDTRFAVGLRSSGVLGVICARHEVMLGLGDLQKGERYKNTDFVLVTVLGRLDLKEVCATYDIACQYRKNFEERIKALPPAMVDFLKPTIHWGLPVWHGNVHDVFCETSESLKYKVGVGKTDGEGIERVWALLNPFAYMTREMLPGARHDDIEDKLNRHNFLKNIGIGKALLRRLRIALEERGAQIEAFSEVNRPLRTDLRNEWTAMVLNWVEDPTKPNPYAPSKTAMTSEAEVRRNLRTEEAEEAAADVDAERAVADAEDAALDNETTPSAPSTRSRGPPSAPSSQSMSLAGFIILGLQCEEGQHRIILEKTASNLTLSREAKILQRRRVTLANIKEYRKWQSTYMPGVAALLLQDEERRRDRQAAAPLAEEINLYLPSYCTPVALRLESRCTARLFRHEAELRKGQCGDAISRLRARLMAKHYLVNYRNEHLVGQRQTSRASTLILSIAEKVKEAARKYRLARAALASIVGEENCGGFRVLQEEDIAVYEMAESDADAIKRLGRLGGRDSRVTGTGRNKAKIPKRRDAPGETRAKMSWIWTADGGPDDNDDEFLHESVRIEWAKALARKTRWAEEVEILKEEMRRVLRTLTWEEGLWVARANAVSPSVGVEQRGGHRAYALKQADVRRRMRKSFEELWLRSEPSRGQAPGPKDAEAHAALVGLVLGVQRESRDDDLAAAADVAHLATVSLPEGSSASAADTI